MSFMLEDEEINEEIWPSYHIKKLRTHPWEKLRVDMIGQYSIKNKKTGKDLSLHYITTVDPATGWFDMTTTKEKRRNDYSQLGRNQLGYPLSLASRDCL